ncbi:MAG: VCBS repeat-containing protein, partial [Calditrichaeota bacterium]
MLKRNSTIWMMIGLLYAFPQLLSAQSSYSKLLYHVPLTSEAVNPIGAITSTAGEYTSKGWTAKGTNGQLRIDLDGFLPFEGMMEISVSGLMPTVTDEWIPFALYSRGDGNFDKVDPSPGSYAFIKTDERYSGNNLDFKFFGAAFYGANGSNRQDFSIYKRSWSTSTVYKFYIIWNQKTIKLMLNNETLGERKFEKQMESFGYIFLGRDNTYNTTMKSVYYRDLKIYVSETDHPFLSMADAYNEMADKKVGGQGIAIADVDKNGEEDLYVTRFYGAGGDWPNLLYMQSNDSFIEDGTARGVSDPAFSYQPLFADFDKDGDVDLFVNNFSRTPDYTNQPNHLYLNDGNGNFTDASVNLSGNTEADGRSATLIDIENDGDMDVVVLGETAAHKVYINNGSAQFSAQTRGLENFRSSANKYQSAAAGDLNGDGSADLALLHQTGIQIARNNGSGTFVAGPVITLPATAAAVTLADIDNDADLDILSANSGTDNPRVEIMRNDGNLSFTSISGSSSIGVSTFSVLPGDWNNDGKVDIFLIDRNTTGRLYLNDGTGRFTEKTKTGVDAVFADGRGSATLDVNQDGRLDIYAAARGGFAVDDKTKEEKPY